MSGIRLSYYPVISTQNDEEPKKQINRTQIFAACPSRRSGRPGIAKQLQMGNRCLRQWDSFQPGLREMMAFRWKAPNGKMSSKRAAITVSGMQAGLTEIQPAVIAFQRLFLITRKMYGLTKGYLEKQHDRLW